MATIDCPVCGYENEYDPEEEDVIACLCCGEIIAVEENT